VKSDYSMSSPGKGVPNRSALPENPVSALYHLVDKRLIERPVFVGEPLSPDDLPYAIVVEVRGHGYEAAVGKDKADAKRQAAEALLVRILRSICPTPTKMRYATEEMARKVVTHRKAVGAIPLKRWYECSCGWWHVTSHENRGTV